MSLALISCSANMDNSDPFDDFLNEWDITLKNDCPEVTDAYSYPEPWTREIEKAFSIPDETLNSMSTCGLIETLLNYPRDIVGPWNWELSHSFRPGVTMFNESIKANKIAVELFKRKNCIPVLFSIYISTIKEESCVYGGSRFGYFELLLSSDLCMNTLNELEKKQLMAITLERVKYVENESLVQTCHIMISIMKFCNYTPFIEDIGSRLNECTTGYTLSNFIVKDDGNSYYIGEDADGNTHSLENATPLDEKDTMTENKVLTYTYLSPYAIKTTIAYANMFLIN